MDGKRRILVRYKGKRYRLMRRRVMESKFTNEKKSAGDLYSSSELRNR